MAWWIGAGCFLLFHPPLAKFFDRYTLLQVAEKFENVNSNATSDNDFVTLKDIKSLDVTGDKF